MSDVLEALTRIREAAERHMDKRDELDLGWAEESVTDVSCHEGQPDVKVVQFTRQQEGQGIGADYLWWWLEQDSLECFGMLVQAKRLHRAGSSWTVNVRHGDGRQMHDLIATAEQLKVPAIYGVYTGGRVLRKDLPCLHSSDPDCLDCRRMAISLISAYQLTLEQTPTANAAAVFNNSVPLESLGDPTRSAGQVRDLNLRDIPHGSLRDFLLTEQNGPREIAKKLFKLVSERRRRLFTAATPDLLSTPTPTLFPDVPADPSHFPGPYYRHMLQGLRRRRPRYVDELLRPPDLRAPDLPEGSFGYMLPPSPRRPRALQGVDIDGVVLVTL